MRNMRRIPVRFWVLALVLIALNLGAWYLVRRELLVRANPAIRPVTVVDTLPHQNVDDLTR